MSLPGDMVTINFYLSPKKENPRECNDNRIIHLFTSLQLKNMILLKLQELIGEVQ